MLLEFAPPVLTVAIAGQSVLIWFFSATATAPLVLPCTSVRYICSPARSFARVSGENGDVDEAERLVDQAEGLREQRAKVKKLADARIGANSAAGVEQRVCQVSGLIVKGEEEGHKNGRNFQAWERLHNAWARLHAVVQGRRRPQLDYMEEQEEGQV